MKFSTLTADATIVGDLSDFFPFKDAETIAIRPQSEHDEWNERDDTIILSCACYDPVKNKVYVGYGGCTTSHGDLIHLHQGDLDSNGNQERLDDLIFGFLISNGTFCNRIQAHRHALKSSTFLLKDKGRFADEYFNSEYINWGMVQEYAGTLECRAERKQ